MRIRRRWVRPGELFGPTPSVGPILDRNLTVLQGGRRWSFQGGRVCVDGRDIGALMVENPAVSYWVWLAEGLQEYKREVLASRRRIPRLSQFMAMVDALIERIFSKVRLKYDEKTSGLAWRIEGEQFLINDLNVRSFLATYKMRPTSKAWRFLNGLKGKLELILKGHGGSELEKVRHIVQDLYEEICAELKKEPPSDSDHPLLSDRSRSR